MFKLFCDKDKCGNKSNLLSINSYELMNDHNCSTFTLNIYLIIIGESDADHAPPEFT